MPAHQTHARTEAHATSVESTDTRATVLLDTLALTANNGRLVLGIVDSKILLEDAIATFTMTCANGWSVIILILVS